ncbi:hypothetical protein GGI22_002738, partial [Coemansia erecta]
LVVKHLFPGSRVPAAAGRARGHHHRGRRQPASYHRLCRGKAWHAAAAEHTGWPPDEPHGHKPGRLQPEEYGHIDAYPRHPARTRHGTAALALGRAAL